VSNSEARWREPASLLPLHWGHYADRYVFGIVLVVGGAIQLQGSNTFTLNFLLIGMAAHITGWAILPSRGWRRIVVIVPATAQIWLLLTGPLSVWMFAIPFTCWLVVRHRPWRSYPTIALPIAHGIVLPHFFTEYSAMPQAISISMAVLVGSAWIARAIATTVPTPSTFAKSRSTIV